MIQGNQTIEYELRLWIDSSVTDENLIKNKTRAYKIHVEAVQEGEEVSMMMARPHSGEQYFWKYSD